MPDSCEGLYSERLYLCSQLLKVTSELSGVIDGDILRLLDRLRERETIFQSLEETERKVKRMEQYLPFSGLNRSLQEKVNEVSQATGEILQELGRLDKNLIPRLEKRLEEIAVRLADNATKRNLTKSYQSLNTQTQPKFMDERT